MWFLRERSNSNAKAESAGVAKKIFRRKARGTRRKIIGALLGAILSFCAAIYLWKTASPWTESVVFAIGILFCLIASFNYDDLTRSIVVTDEFVFFNNGKNGFRYPFAQMTTLQKRENNGRMIYWVHIDEPVFLYPNELDFQLTDDWEDVESLVQIIEERSGKKFEWIEE